jgi:hypothetical protein
MQKFIYFLVLALLISIGCAKVGSVLKEDGNSITIVDLVSNTTFKLKNIKDQKIVVKSPELNKILKSRFDRQIISIIEPVTITFSNKENTEGYMVTSAMDRFNHKVFFGLNFTLAKDKETNKYVINDGDETHICDAFCSSSTGIDPICLTCNFSYKNNKIVGCHCNNKQEACCHIVIATE